MLVNGYFRMIWGRETLLNKFFSILNKTTCHSLIVLLEF